MLPLFYFKPTICWVDDDQIFLDAVTSVFSQKYNCISFQSANAAKTYFDHYQAPLRNMSFKKELTEDETFGMSKHLPIDINFSSIDKLISLEGKQEEIAVLVVDYHMNEMNGLELCRRLENFKGKKILLTGEATPETAIEAFNNGLIDKFIRKSVNSFALLQEYIDSLTYQYFCDKTASLVAHIEAAKASVFTDKQFIEFFKSWCKDHSIVEYYLLNKQGSFAVKDATGKTSYFILQSEEDNAYFAELYDESVGEAAKLVAGVASGKLIPFFGASKEAWQVAESEWPPHFYPAQELQGREKYFWTVVAGQ